MADGKLNKCKACCIADSRAARASNPQRHVVWCRAPEARNPRNYVSRRKWNHAQVPAWYGELDELVWVEAHDLAARLTQLSNVKFCVDHVVPGKGKTVSGLHWHRNWQVISHLANASKGVKHAA